MGKATTNSYVLTLRLKTNDRDVAILNKRFRIAEHLYNSLLNVMMKRVNLLTSNPEYQSIQNQLKTSDNKKELYSRIKEMQKQLQLNEYGCINAMTPMRKRFTKNIDNKTAQAIASRVWKSIEKALQGNKVHYKKKGTLFSVEGKWNKSGIRYIKDKQAIVWNGLELPLIIRKKDEYARTALEDRVKYCKIIRQQVKGKDVFYAQLVLEGTPPNKNRVVGVGDVGIDIGPSTIAVVGEKQLALIELADKVQNIENQKRIILRKLDRSRRVMNPNNFNEDGTIKRQKRMKWNTSNHYLKLQKQLKELYRKQAAVRKYQHECLANQILVMGDTFYVEDMNIAGLAKRANKTEISEKTGKFKRKKRFGKSIANRAPSMLLTILNRKLSVQNKTIIKINTQKAKASQYDHTTGEYQKKALSQRWNDIDGIKVQRDLYSAFLIMNINEDLESFNEEKCRKRFNDFIIMHDNEIKRLKNQKNLSSIGI